MAQIATRPPFGEEADIAGLIELARSITSRKIVLDTVYAIVVIVSL